MVWRFQLREVERTQNVTGIRGGDPLYTEGNPSTAFAARLISQYESHIRVTKQITQPVVNLTKETPHINWITKRKNIKLSQQVYHQGTVRQGSS